MSISKKIKEKIIGQLIDISAGEISQIAAQYLPPEVADTVSGQRDTHGRYTLSSDHYDMPQYELPVDEPIGSTLSKVLLELYSRLKK